MVDQESTQPCRQLLACGDSRSLVRISSERDSAKERRRGARAVSGCRDDSDSDITFSCTSCSDRNDGRAARTAASTSAYSGTSVTCRASEEKVKERRLAEKAEKNREKEKEAEEGNDSSVCARHSSACNDEGMGTEARRL